MATEAESRRSRKNERRRLQEGGRRMPGGIMPTEAAEALDEICKRTGEPKLSVIARLLIAEAATTRA